MFVWLSLVLVGLWSDILTALVVVSRWLALQKPSLIMVHCPAKVDRFTTVDDFSALSDQKSSGPAAALPTGTGPYPEYSWKTGQLTKATSTAINAGSYIKLFDYVHGKGKVKSTVLHKRA